MVTVDVRGKLTRILTSDPEMLRNLNVSTIKLYRLVDKMIAHGVTVQEWISVSERLPENFVSVLGYMPDAGPFPTVRECYTVGTAFFFPALLEVRPISHWMPMPEPPKIAGAKSEARCQYLGSGPLEGRCMATRDTEPCIGYGNCLVYKPEEG